MIFGLMAMLLVFTAAAQPKRTKADVKKEKQLVGSFVDVPATHYTIRDSNGNDSLTVSIASFRMLATEVSIASYNLFLDDLKAQGRQADYEAARIDTSRAMPYLPTTYFTLPSFGQHPVSCISYEGAMLFCQWLTEKAGGGEWIYTLPTEVQWKHAARSGRPPLSYGCPFPYSMESPFLTNKNGESLYTYLKVGDERITMKDGHLSLLDSNREIVNDSKILSSTYFYSPTPIWSHHPNGLGLFNMCGNVAEMVYECGVAFGGSFFDPGFDIRIDSEKHYDAPSSLIGFRVIACNVEKEKVEGFQHTVPLLK